MWEPRRVVPMYAVPPADVSASLVPSAAAEVPERLPPVLGPVHFEWHHTPGQSFDVVVGDRTFPAAGFAPDDPDLGGRVVIDWGPFDWVEEAHPVVGHPHDPFKRIDLLPSDRHVVVRLGGVTLADTRQRDRAVRDPHPGALVPPPRRRRDRPPRRQPVDHDLRLQGARHLRLDRARRDRRDR